MEKRKEIMDIVKRGLKKRALQSILDSEKVIMYGIGNQCKECYSILKKGDNILLVDSNKEKQGKIWKDNLVINSPQILKEYKNKNIAVVISSIYNQYEIYISLKNDYGIKDEVIYSYTSKTYEQQVYKTEDILQHMSEVEKCEEIMSDDASKKYYRNSINARIYRSPAFLEPNCKMASIGEYADIIKIRKGNVFIDCGAFNGDTVQLYMNKTQGDCKVYAIEPFRENFQGLMERISCNGWEEKVFAFNMAVGERAELRSIKYNKGDFEMAMNLFREDGEFEQEVKVRPLDEICNEKINYIKMDIEGEEAAALRGAKGLIKKYKPQLMISAYHKVQDLWELPLLIKELNPSYQIYAGHAPGVSMEIEFYCINK